MARDVRPKARLLENLFQVKEIIAFECISKSLGSRLMRFGDAKSHIYRLEKLNK